MISTIKFWCEFFLLMQQKGIAQKGRFWKIAAVSADRA
jgi:hypothetical protein